MQLCLALPRLYCSLSADAPCLWQEKHAMKRMGDRMPLSCALLVNAFVKFKLF